MARRGRKAANSLEDTISRIGDNVTALSEVIGETASEEAKASIRALRQRLDELADESDGLMAQRLQETRGAISDNPLIAVAAAFGLGVIMGAVLRR
jgi:CHASE3 domain sensor protein